MPKQTNKTDNKPDTKEEVKAEEPKVEEKQQPQTGHINTTENTYVDEDDEPTPRERAELTDKERKAIVEKVGENGAVIADIAADYDITPAEVMEIANKG